MTQLQEVTGDLPLNNIQGIVSVGEIGVISATEDVLLDAETLGLSLYPVPSSGEELNVEFTLEESSPYAISIFDLQGQAISENQLKGEGVAGINTVSLNELTLNTGFYVLKLDLEEGSVSRKFVIQRQ